MKNVIAILVVALTFLSFNSAAVAYTNDLTKSEQKAFLRAINRAGLDTWHEGDFQYKYLSAGCNFKVQECWVYIEMSYNNKKETACCAGEGFTEFSQVYDADKKRITMGF